MVVTLMLVLPSCARLLSEKTSFTFLSCTKETPVLPRLSVGFWLLRFTDEVKKCLDAILENALLLTVFRGSLVRRNEERANMNVLIFQVNYCECLFSVYNFSMGYFAQL